MPFSTKCENSLLLGNFSACVDDETMKDICSSYCLKGLIKQPTCFKNSENPSCIDLILNLTSHVIALFVVSGSIKKLFSIDCASIYFFQSIVNYLF